MFQHDLQYCTRAMLHWGIIISPSSSRVCGRCTTWHMVITSSKSMDQPGKVSNPARDQLNRENEYLARGVRLSRLASA